MNNRNAKFTPGPWVLEETEETLFVLASGKCDAQIASIEIGTDLCVLHDETGEFESKANARLIAAAPELLEALIKFRKLLPVNPAPDGWTPEWSRELDALITKATGGAE